PSADFNGDHIVDGQDLLIWQFGLGLTGQSGNTSGDANRDGTVDAADLIVLQSQFGTNPANLVAGAGVPEPSSAMLAVFAASLLSSAMRRTIRPRVSLARHQFSTSEV